MADEKKRTPLVFISYSHDSKDHKMWVLEFAQGLVKVGIDVKFDQWDLGPGDDVVKFMERWVTDAERVLMICSETYVQKVNEGKGGAGYEAMIVTGELVQNLGTKKFVPIVRQAPGKFELPKCVGTRLAVNLSGGQDAGAELAKLVDEIHQLPPASKPPLGTAPTRTGTTHTIAQTSSAIAGNAEPPTIFNQAAELAQSGNLVLWRRLIQTLKIQANTGLSEKRQKWEPAPPKMKEELADFVADCISPFSLLIAAALAGVESGQPKFNQQAGLLHDLIEPKDWQPSGYSLITQLPEALGFVYQALLGSAYVYTTQSDLAIEMAIQRVYRRVDGTSGPLWSNKGLVGWPDPLDGDCTRAWRFLWSLPDRWTWLSVIFGDVTAFRRSVCGYYALLSWVEFMEALRAKVFEGAGDRELLPDVPVLFLAHEEHVAGIRMLMDDRKALQDFAAKSEISADFQKEHWARWTKMTEQWLGKVLRHFHRYREPESFQRLVEDLLR